MTDTRHSWLKARGITRGAVAVYVALLAVIALAQLIAVLAGVPTAFVTADVNAVLDAPVYTGFLSQIGLFMWSAAAAVCLLAYVARRGANSTSATYLLAAGALSTFLLIDDAFELHESVFPALLGIPDVVTYAAYGLLVAGFLVWFRHRILATPYLPLLLALAFGATSIALDVVADMRLVTIPHQYLLEDGTKTLAIGSWLLYFARQSLAEVRGG